MKLIHTVLLSSLLVLAGCATTPPACPVGQEPMRTAQLFFGQNIGAMLETDRAEADKKIAQAKAEERRAMAVATDQEMKAKVMEMKAKLVDSETQVPLAMADALRTGKLGVMDYYNLQNVKADTQMRSELGNPDAGASNT